MRGAPSNSASWARREAGSAATELALVLPVLLLVLTGIVDYGSLAFKYMQVTAAAHSGVEYAITNGFDATKISTAIVNATSGGGVAASPAPTEASGCVSTTYTLVVQTSTTCSGANTAAGTSTGTFVFVHATAPFTPLLHVWGSLMPNSITANAVVMISQPRGGRMRRPALGLRRFWRDTSGAAAAEFAVVSLVLFALLFGVIEFGLLFWTQTGLNFAVEQAARYYAVQTAAGSTLTSAQVAAYAVTQAPGLNFPASAFTATLATCGQATAVNYQVTGIYTFQFIPSHLLPANPRLVATACFP